MEKSGIYNINRNDELDGAIIIRFPNEVADKIRAAMQNKEQGICFEMICKEPRKYEYTLN